MFEKFNFKGVTGMFPRGLEVAQRKVIRRPRPKTKDKRARSTRGIEINLINLKKILKFNIFKLKMFYKKLKNKSIRAARLIESCNKKIKKKCFKL